jgi:hypothetical protein
MRRWHSLGYWGSFITFVGATIFWVATIVGVPNCLPDPITHYVEWDVLYWGTQVRPPAALAHPPLHVGALLTGSALNVCRCWAPAASWRLRCSSCWRRSPTGGSPSRSAWGGR